MGEMKYTKEFVIEFAKLVRAYYYKSIDELFDNFTDAIGGFNEFKLSRDPQQSIFIQVLFSAAEMCNVTMEEIASGRKYGDIPTAKQLTSKILSELGYSQELITKELPELGKRNAVQQQIMKAGQYEERNVLFANVLNQLRGQFDIGKDKP